MTTEKNENEKIENQNFEVLEPADVEPASLFDDIELPPDDHVDDDDTDIGDGDDDTETENEGGDSGSDSSENDESDRVENTQVTDTHKLYADIIVSLADSLFGVIIFSVIFKNINFTEKEITQIMPDKRSIRALQDAWAKLVAYYQWTEKASPVIMVILATASVYGGAFASAMRISKKHKKQEETQNKTQVAIPEPKTTPEEEVVYEDDGAGVLQEKRGRGRPKGSKNKPKNEENV